MRHARAVSSLIAFLLAFVAQLSVSSAQTKITIGYAAVSPMTTPMYLAQEQGSFAKYGLDPKIVLVVRARTHTCASFFFGGRRKRLRPAEANSMPMNRLNDSE